LRFMDSCQAQKGEMKVDGRAPVLFRVVACGVEVRRPRGGCEVAEERHC